jgi:hypothetical protein
MHDPRKKEASVPDALAGEIENFVNTSKSRGIRPEPFDPSYVMRSISVDGGSRLDEKSIAS